MQNEKTYKFSLRKHGHDINYRCDLITNIIMELESKGIEPYPSTLALKENLTKILTHVSNEDGVVQLSSKLYKIAIESVAWAAAHR